MFTLFCAFDDREAARRAVVRMIRAGLPRDDIHIRPEPSFYDRVEASDLCQSKVPLLSRLAIMVFGGPSLPGTPGTYRDAVRRGSTVVVVHADDADEAHELALEMSRHGAFDVEQHRSRAAHRLVRE